jgi:hypothetical protein
MEFFRGRLPQHLDLMHLAAIDPERARGFRP